MDCSLLRVRAHAGQLQAREDRLAWMSQAVQGHGVLPHPLHTTGVALCRATVVLGDQRRAAHTREEGPQDAAQPVLTRGPALNVLTDPSKRPPTSSSRSAQRCSRRCQSALSASSRASASAARRSASSTSFCAAARSTLALFTCGKSGRIEYMHCWKNNVGALNVGQLLHLGSASSLDVGVVHLQAAPREARRRVGQKHEVHQATAVGWCPPAGPLQQHRWLGHTQGQAALAAASKSMHDTASPQRSAARPTSFFSQSAASCCSLSSPCSRARAASAACAAASPSPRARSSSSRDCRAGGCEMARARELTSLTGGTSEAYSHLPRPLQVDSASRHRPPSPLIHS